MTNPIKLSPTSLTWEIPAGVRRMTQSLELANQNAEQYLFKIKGTTRSRFIVQPASGLIRAFQKVKVNFVVDLPSNTDTSKPIVDKFVLYTLVAPPGAENKEGLDDYIKTHADTRHETKITSTIHFTRPNDGPDAHADRKPSADSPDLLEGTHGGDRIFESLVSEPLPSVRGEQRMNTDAFKPDEEIFESKVGSTAGEGVRTAAPGPAHSPVVSQTAATDPMTATQLERTGGPGDSESVKRLKDTIYKLQSELRTLTVG